MILEHLCTKGVRLHCRQLLEFADSKQVMAAFSHWVTFELLLNCHLLNEL